QGRFAGDRPLFRDFACLVDRVESRLLAYNQVDVLVHACLESWSNNLHAVSSGRQIRDDVNTRLARDRGALEVCLRVGGRNTCFGNDGSLRPPHGILRILEAESLLKEAGALLIYRLAAEAVAANRFSISTVALFPF